MTQGTWRDLRGLVSQPDAYFWSCVRAAEAALGAGGGAKQPAGSRHRANPRRGRSDIGGEERPSPPVIARLMDVDAPNLWIASCTKPGSGSLLVPENK